MADKIKMILAVLIVAAGVVGYHYFEDQSLLIRVVGMLAVVGVALAVAMQAEAGRAAWVFVKESRVELRKVVWPGRKETTQGTLLVLVMVVLIGLFLWLLDTFLGWAVKMFTGQGG